jgi:hypothetical protein
MIQFFLRREDENHTFIPKIGRSLLLKKAVPWESSLIQSWFLTCITQKKEPEAFFKQEAIDGRDTP